MPTDCSAKLFRFEAVERKTVVAGFDGGAITSKPGALLLGQVDQGLLLIRRFATCFTDRRDPRFVEHGLEILPGQHVFGLALGYEDLNDHDELRKDPALGVLASKLKPTFRTDCEALAGKSTLNRLEMTPKRHGPKYHKIDFHQATADALLVDLFSRPMGRCRGLEPIFEAQFWHVSYGFRPGRSIHAALEYIRRAILPQNRDQDGHRRRLPYPWVIEGDIKAASTISTTIT